MKVPGILQIQVRKHVINKYTHLAEDGQRQALNIYVKNTDM